MFDDLVLHPQTKQQLERFILRPTHALSLVAPQGAGKYHLARNLAAHLLNLDSTKKLANYPYYHELQKAQDKQQITIESVRELLRPLKLRTTGKGDIRRVIVIENAHYMNAESQNALLKSLEEPSLDSIFILTVVGNKSLLPTIYSRTQKIPLLPPNIEDARSLFEKTQSSNNFEAAWNLSGGLMGLLHALLRDDTQHPLKAAIADAKTILGETPYQRLLRVDALSRDKTAVADLIEATAKILAVLHHSAIQKGDKPKIDRLQKSREHIFSIRRAFLANAQPKLLLTHFMLSI